MEFGPLDYYSRLPADGVLRELRTSGNLGLTESEARRRIAHFGKNEVEAESEETPLSEFLHTFRNPLVTVLIVAAAVSALLGEVTEPIIILTIVLASSALGVWQEHSANDAVKKLKSLVAVTATVIRNGERKEIRTPSITVGDVILLSAGDLVPADCRVIEENDIYVKQSAITGEPFPVEKTVGGTGEENRTAGDVQMADSKEETEGKKDKTGNSQAADASEVTAEQKGRNDDTQPQADFPNILFAGTNVVSGSATAVVLKVGRETQFGAIAKEVAVEAPESAFEIGVRGLGISILKITVFIVLVISLLNLWLHRGFLESLVFAIAVAVGLTPELLPIIMTVTMAAGAKNIAGKGAIVKKLPSIPNFGSMDVLCTDKTGTLTEGKIRLVKYIDVNGGESGAVLRHAFLNSYFQTGIKNALDEAVVERGGTAAQGAVKVGEIPFDFSRKRIGIGVKLEGRHYLITKGAPEEVFKISTHYSEGNGKSGAGERESAIVGRERKPLTPEAVEKFHSLFEKLSSEGYKVLAIAVKELEGPRKGRGEVGSLSTAEEKGMELLGFIAFFDPPKPTARAAVRRIIEAGIEIKVITGDNELVAKKVCDEVGLPVKGVMLGREIEGLGIDALAVKAQNATIFARFSPEEKRRVIEALKGGRVVGYLGDGINDAPSLRAADVGISVNNAGDVAKESADIVLTHKSLSVLIDGVLEGRRTFANTLKYVLTGVSSNFGNMLSFTGAVVLAPFIPMLPVQILLNNLLYDFSQVSIPYDNVDGEDLKKPKRWNLDFVEKFMIAFGLASSVFDLITFFALLYVFNAAAPQFQTGWFLESIATQALVIHVIRTRKIPFVQSSPGRFLLAATAAAVALGWLIPYSPLAPLIGFTPLPAPALAAIVAITAAYLVAVEGVKGWFYARWPVY